MSNNNETQNIVLPRRRRYSRTKKKNESVLHYGALLNFYYNESKYRVQKFKTDNLSVIGHRIDESD